jgi:hypothetical protein
MNLLHKFSNVAQGIEGRVWEGGRGAPGTFAVTLLDLDAELTCESSRHGIRSEAAAIALAKEWAGLGPAKPVSVPL